MRAERVARVFGLNAAEVLGVLMFTTGGAGEVEG